MIIRLFGNGFVMDGFVELHVVRRIDEESE